MKILCVKDRRKKGRTKSTAFETSRSTLGTSKDDVALWRRSEPPIDPQSSLGSRSANVSKPEFVGRARTLKSCSNSNFKSCFHPRRISKWINQQVKFKCD